MKIFVTRILLPLLAVVGALAGASVAQNQAKPAETGTLETLIVASGTVAMDLDLNRLNGITSGADSRRETLRFQTATDSFFPVLVFNNRLRGARPGSIGLIPQNNSLSLPAQLSASLSQLVVAKTATGAAFDIVVQDAKTGFVFFNIEGNRYQYNAAAHSLQIESGRLLLSEDFAKSLGRPAEAGAVVGGISIAAQMRPIEVAKVVNGINKSLVLPSAPNAAAFVPGPDVIVGDLTDLQQFGGSGTQVGLAMTTISCNQGAEELNWFGMPATDHPLIPQNLYRMSGGAGNNERFEQIGQSWIKHAFLALQEDSCALGCSSSPTVFARLGSGCSDPYTADLNADPTGLGSRAWVNPFTGAFPGGVTLNGESTAQAHSGHAHSGVSHRLMVEQADLNTNLNVGATYYAESVYITPHEYSWCQSNPGQCNMYNNASYRRFLVSGTTDFFFTPSGSTVQKTPAIYAWTGATVNVIEPAPGVDGRGFVACKVTGPVGGMWHYEYAINNQQLDRAIQSFSVPLGCGTSVSNLGFHAPLNEQGWRGDGTTGDAGFSNAPWATNQTSNALTWSSQTFAQNPNANAIRWGTLYNFRFDSNRPPVATNATIGFFKTGAPITVAIQAPMPCGPLTFASAVSRETHGSAGTFDIDLPLSGEPGVECRAGGAGNSHTVIVTFTNNVVSGNASVTAGTGSVAGTPVVSANEMTVNLSGISDRQKITLTLNNVTDEFGQVMPDTILSVNMLIGDTTGNKTVNASDIGQTKGASGATAGASNFRADVNVNGAINSSDIGMVKAASGNSVP